MEDLIGKNSKKLIKLNHCVDKIIQHLQYFEFVEEV